MMQTQARDNVAAVLVKFSLPLIISGILQQLYNWADAFIVGHAVGESALAAVGATTAVSVFFTMAITGFTQGLSILAAQRFGSGDRGGPAAHPVHLPDRAAAPVHPLCRFWGAGQRLPAAPAPHAGEHSGLCRGLSAHHLHRRALPGGV